MSTIGDSAHTIVVDVLDAVACRDEAEALSLLDCLSESERRAVRLIAARLAYLADDTNRCVDCRTLVEERNKPYNIRYQLVATRCAPHQREHLIATAPPGKAAAWRMALGVERRSDATG